VIRRAALVLAVALTTLTGAASADAHGQRPGAALPLEEVPPIALELATFAPSVVKADNSLNVLASVENSTAVAMVGVTASLSVTAAPLATSAQLERFLEDPTATPLRLATSTPVPANSLTANSTSGVLPPLTTVSVDLAATTERLGFPAKTTGVYGVVISVADASGTLATRTAAITWYDAPLPELPIALVATASGSAERVARVAAAANVRGAAVAIDPVAVTDGSAAYALTVGREVFGLPSGDPDITSLAHAGDTALIYFALNDAATNSAPALQNLPWLATIPVVDAPTISFAASHGATAGILDVTGGARLVTDAPVVDVRVGSDTLPMLVPDTRLSTILATYRPGQADAAARLVAEAALTAKNGDGLTPVVVAPGNAWQLPDPSASQPVTSLLNAPWVVPVSVRSLLSDADRDDFTASDSLGTEEDLAPKLIAALTRQLDSLQELSQTAEDPNTVYIPGARTLLAPLAVSLRPDPDARTAAYEASRTAVDGVLSSLYVAEGSDVNLIAASGNVPVTLHNDLDVDATVTVVMMSSSPNLVVQDRPVVTIPAGGDVTAHIAVTGVKSANVTATVALKNARGDVVAAPQVLRVRVRADWGNAVTAVFSVGLGLLLIAGVIRTMRRGRRSSRMAPMAAGATTPTMESPEDTDAGGGDG
jgi:hypothetical protein